MELCTRSINNSMKASDAISVGSLKYRVLIFLIYFYGVKTLKRRIRVREGYLSLNIELLNDS